VPAPAERCVHSAAQDEDGYLELSEVNAAPNPDGAQGPMRLMPVSQESSRMVSPGGGSVVNQRRHRAWVAKTECLRVPYRSATARTAAAVMSADSLPKAAQN
jgi:hypothetical protein